MDKVLFDPQCAFLDELPQRYELKIGEPVLVKSLQTGWLRHGKIKEIDGINIWIEVMGGGCDPAEPANSYTIQATWTKFRIPDTYNLSYYF